MRELHFAVERAGLLAEGDVIDVADLPPEIVEKTRPRVACRARASAPPPQSPARRSTTTATATTTTLGPGAARVREALEQAKWRRGKAAEILGVSPRTLYRWMKRMGL